MMGGEGDDEVGASSARLGCKLGAGGDGIRVDGSVDTTLVVYEVRVDEVVWRCWRVLGREGRAHGEELDDDLATMPDSWFRSGPGPRAPGDARDCVITYILRSVTGALAPTAPDSMQGIWIENDDHQHTGGTL